MRESKIEKEVTEYAKQQGWLAFKFVSPQYRSVPDKIFIKDGEVIFIEFKAKGKRPTKLQTKTIDKIRNEKIDVFIVDSTNDGKAIFDMC